MTTELRGQNISARDQIHHPKSPRFRTEQCRPAGLQRKPQSSQNKLGIRRVESETGREITPRRSTSKPPSPAEIRWAVRKWLRWISRHLLPWFSQLQRAGRATEQSPARRAAPHWLNNPGAATTSAGTKEGDKDPEATKEWRAEQAALLLPGNYHWKVRK